MKRIRKIIDNPKLLIIYITQKKIGHILPDKLYVKLKYRVVCNSKLNLKHPKTFNEKLQWLKLNDRKEIYTTMVDKYAVKKYISDIIGEEYVIPTLGIYDKYDDIDFDSLPDMFVIKCTHDSGGGLVICRDKSQLDHKWAKNKIEKSLKYNYYWNCREWPYKNVPRRILVEKYMEDNSNKGKNLNVYKIFCFNGEPKIFQVIQNDKTQDETIDYFDADWNLLKMKQSYPNSAIPLNKPQRVNEMIDIAKKLSNGFPFLRVDLYEINGSIYFSELTFYSDAGFGKFQPPEWDDKLGEWIKL